MVNRLPAEPSSKCRPLLFWCCWVLVNPRLSESGLCNILFIQNLIFLRLLLAAGGFATFGSAIVGGAGSTFWALGFRPLDLGIFDKL